MATSVSQSGGAADRVELLLAQLDSLPTLPAVAVKLLELTTSSESSIREVARLVASDQSLAAKILSITRRVATGAGSHVSTVERAVLLLGFDAVRNACLSIKVFEVFARRESAAETAFDRTEFWKHSLAVACGAQLAAEELRARIEPEQAFVCGLLHDIGKVALDACLPKSFDRIVRRANSLRACLADIEREILGVDHTVIGHRLAQRWRLPAPVVECIWLHHNSPDTLPASVRHAELVGIVHFADRLARDHRIGYSGNHAGGPPAASLAARIGLSEKACERITAELAGRIEERAHLIGIDRLTSQDLYMQALADANRELSRINQSLSDSNRRLAARDRYFRALNRMNQRLAPSATPGEACAVAAEVAGSALDTAAATFFFSPATGLVHVGLSGAGETAEARCGTWPASDFAPWPELPNAGGGGVPPIILSSGAAAPALAERIEAEVGAALPWLCPLFQDENGFAGILLAGSPDAASAWQRESEELGALLTGIRLWLANIETQQKAQRLNEGLADVNRRLAQAQGEAARMRSLAMIAEMAAGAAHELNNPLAVISGRAQMLQSRPPDEATGRIAEVLAEQARRCSEIVSELMAFAKPDPPQRQRVSLGALLERVRDDWIESQGLSPEQISLDLSDDAPSVHVDPAQIQAALDELVRNAVDATTTSPARRIQLKVVSSSSDDRIVVRVEDNGCGMSPETLERAMDPFFSHRPAGRRRGLGLSRAARWIEINGGRLRLDSREGEGTIAFVEFPAGPALAESTPTPG